MNNSCHNNKLVIKKDSEYPVLKGFPKTLEELSILGLNKKSFDRQILNLKFLKVLNLSNNQISSLPKEVGCLQHLQELILAHNFLGKSQSDWRWINQPEIKKNLRLLDIRSNIVSWSNHWDTTRLALVETNFITCGEIKNWHIMVFYHYL